MVVGFFSLLGGLTGILVETSIAAQLGLSRSSDTFYVAFTIPYIITTLISATGQFSLVPFFASLEARHSSEDLWRGFSYAVNMACLGLAAIAALGAAWAAWVVRGIAPGLAASQVELGAQLCRWLFLIIIPAGMAEVFRSFLLSQRRFAFPSAAGLIRNATVIACIVLGFSRYREFSIVLGYLAGCLLQFVVLGGQILVSFPARYSLTLAGSGGAFRRLRSAGSAQIGAALGWQGVVIVERIIASFLPPGTITALNYGLKIMSTLTELLAGSVGTAALPALSRAFARLDHAEGRRTFRDTLEISLALVSPIAVFCLVLDRNIIRLIFERGNFTPEMTTLMALVFFYYSLSLLAFSFIRVLTFYLFARHEASIFFRLSLLQFGLNVAFDLFYVGLLRWGAKGIPLGLLTGLALTAALAVYRNVANVRGVLDRSLAIFSAKDLLGAGVAAIVLWGMRAWLTPPTTGFGNFLYLCLLCGVGGLVFLGTLVTSRAAPLAHLAAGWRGGEGTGEP